MDHQINLTEIIMMDKSENGKGLIRQLMEWGTLAPEGEHLCLKCNHSMRLELNGSNYRWKCYHRIDGKKCNYAVSLKTGTIFACSHLSILQICMIANLWVDNVHLGVIRKQVRIMSQHTIVDWCSHLRAITVHEMITNYTPIGGPGTMF